MPDFSFEIEAKQKGYKFVCGVDEAGRGPLAGPVCAAAVILPDNCDIPGLNDSKKLTEKKREALFDVIKEKAIAYNIEFGTVDEIEQINILNATFLAMNRAIDGLSVKCEYALIDGNRIPTDIKVPAEAVVKGDAKSMSIAAAALIVRLIRNFNTHILEIFTDINTKLGIIFTNTACKHQNVNAVHGGNVRADKLNDLIALHFKCQSGFFIAGSCCIN